VAVSVLTPTAEQQQLRSLVCFKTRRLQMFCGQSFMQNSGQNLPQVQSGTIKGLAALEKCSVAPSTNGHN